MHQLPASASGWNLLIDVLQSVNNFQAVVDCVGQRSRVLRLKGFGLCRQTRLKLPGYGLAVMSEDGWLDPLPNHVYFGKRICGGGKVLLLDVKHKLPLEHIQPPDLGWDNRVIESKQIHDRGTHIIGGLPGAERVLRR